jgi:single stranded DNA-binding protein
MSAGFNQAIILGRLTASPEHIQTKSGSLMIKAILEVSTYRRSAEGQGEEQVTRIPCTIFGKTAETFERYVQIGDSCQLAGRLDGFERKGTTGQKWVTINFVVEQLTLLNNWRPSTNPTGERKLAQKTNERQPARQAFPQQSQPRREPSLNELGEPDDIPF